MMDRIEVRGVTAVGRHGVYAAERARGQRFAVDVVLSVDTAPAAASDDLADTVDYGALARRVAAVLEGPPVALLETLAQRVADECLADPRVGAVQVTVHKPDAPLDVTVADVAVTLARAQSAPAVFSLGSNLGDRLRHLQTGVDVLAAALGRVSVSPVYETTPVGGPPQDDYLNAVVIADAADTGVLIAVIAAAEAAAGRARTERWGPRTLDVDLVACGARRSADPRLTVPHPRAHERAFVLAPWLDLDPAAELPGRGAVATVLAGLDRSGVRCRDDLRLQVPA